MKICNIVFLGSLLVGTLIYSAEPETKLSGAKRVIVSKPGKNSIEEAESLFWRNAEIASSEERSLKDCLACVENMNALMQTFPDILGSRFQMGINPFEKERMWSPLEVAAYCAGRFSWTNQLKKSRQWLALLKSMLHFDVNHTRRIMALKEGVRCLSVDVIQVFLDAGTDISGATILPLTLMKECERLTRYKLRDGRGSTIKSVVNLLIEARVGALPVSGKIVDHIRICNVCDRLRVSCLVRSEGQRAGRGANVSKWTRYGIDR